MRGLKFAVLFVLFNMITAPLSADTIRVIIDKSGRKIFTNEGSPSKRNRAKLSPEKYEPFLPTIRRLCDRYRVDINLVLALIAVESDFRIHAVSRAGAIGLMQIMPETAERYGINPWNPEENLEGGIRHLAYLLKRYPNIQHALAAYNAGETAVDQYGGIPPYPETRQYVIKVLQLYHQHPRFAYRWRDHRGVTYFTYERPKPGTYKTLKRLELRR